jgi:hypothetical protein
MFRAAVRTEPRPPADTRHPMTRHPRTILAAATLLLVAAAFLILPAMQAEPVDHEPHGDPATAAIVGRLLDEHDRPLGNVTIRCLQPTDHAAMATLHHDTATTTTAADGTFRCEGLSGREASVRIDDPNQRIEGSSGRIELRPGHTATGLVVRARPIPAARQLRGRLRLANGEPAAHRFVVVGETTWLGQWQVTAATDAEGRFELLAPHARAEGALHLHGDGEPGQPIALVRFGDPDLDLVVPARR